MHKPHGVFPGESLSPRTKQGEEYSERRGGRENPPARQPASWPLHTGALAPSLGKAMMSSRVPRDAPFHKSSARDHRSRRMLPALSLVVGRRFFFNPRST